MLKQGLTLQLERPLPKGKSKKAIGLMKYELGRKIMTKFVGLRTKTCPAGTQCPGDVP